MVSRLPRSSQFLPSSLSIRSRRLLVTTKDNQLLTYDVGDENCTAMRDIRLREMQFAYCAVETNRETFVVSYRCLETAAAAAGNGDDPKYRISEVDVGGNFLRHCPEGADLGFPGRLVIDSIGRLLVVDWRGRRLLLMNYGRLEVERVILDESVVTGDATALELSAACLLDETGRLIIGWSEPDCIQIFAVH